MAARTHAAWPFPAQSLRELDEEIEDFFRELGEDIDFEVDDAVRKLVEDGFVSIDSPTLSVVSTLRVSTISTLDRRGRERGTEARSKGKGDGSTPRHRRTRAHSPHCPLFQRPRHLPS